MARPDVFDSLNALTGMQGEQAQSDFESAPLPYETPAMTQGRVQQGQTQRIQYGRMKAEDLASRGIPYDTSGRGNVSEITDDTGAPLSNADKANKIAYDSSGKPVDYSQKDPTTGKRVLRNPYDFAATQTDAAGNVYKAPKGLPWQQTGEVNPVVQQQAQAKVNAQTATALAPVEQQAKAQFTQAAKAVKISGVQTKQALQTQGVILDPNAPDAPKQLDDAFNKEYGSPEANATPFWGGGTRTPEAEALRKQIDVRKAAANEALAQHQQVITNAQQAQAQLDQVRTQRQQLQGDKMAELNRRRVAVGLEPINIGTQAGPSVADVQQQGATIDTPAPAPIAAATPAAPAQQPAPVAEAQPPALITQNPGNVLSPEDAQKVRDITLQNADLALGPNSLVGLTNRIDQWAIDDKAASLHAQAESATKEALARIAAEPAEAPLPASYSDSIPETGDGSGRQKPLNIIDRPAGSGATEADYPLESLAPLTREKVAAARANGFKQGSFGESAMTPSVEVMKQMGPEQAGKIARSIDPTGILDAMDIHGVDRTAALLHNVTADTVNFFTSPVGVATLGIGALPKVAQRAIAAVFAGQAAHEIPNAVRDVVIAKTPEERDEAIKRAVESAAVLGGTSAHILDRARSANANIAGQEPPNPQQPALPPSPNAPEPSQPSAKSSPLALPEPSVSEVAARLELASMAPNDPMRPLVELQVKQLTEGQQAATQAQPVAERPTVIADQSQVPAIAAEEQPTPPATVGTEPVPVSPSTEGTTPTAPTEQPTSAAEAQQPIAKGGAKEPVSSPEATPKAEPAQEPSDLAKAVKANSQKALDATKGIRIGDQSLHEWGRAQLAKNPSKTAFAVELQKKIPGFDIQTAKAIALALGAEEPKAKVTSPSKSAQILPPAARSLPDAATLKPHEVLNEAKNVKLTTPKGARFLRVTDSKGRQIVEPIENVTKGANVFHQAGPFKRVEAGVMNSKKQFVPLRGEITATDSNKPAPHAFTEHLEKLTKGEPVPVYHGSRNASLSELKPNSSLTLSKTLAGKFATKSGSIYSGLESIPEGTSTHGAAADLLKRIKSGEISPSDAQKEWESRQSEVRLTKPVSVKLEPTQPSPEAANVEKLANAALALHKDSLTALGHPHAFETGYTRAGSGIETDVRSQKKVEAGVMNSKKQFVALRGDITATDANAPKNELAKPAEKSEVAPRETPKDKAGEAATASGLAERKAETPARLDSEAIRANRDELKGTKLGSLGAAGQTSFSSLDQHTKPSEAKQIALLYARDNRPILNALGIDKINFPEKTNAGSGAEFEPSTNSINVSPKMVASAMDIVRRNTKDPRRGQALLMAWLDHEVIHAAQNKVANDQGVLMRQLYTDGWKDSDMPQDLRDAAKEYYGPEWDSKPEWQKRAEAVRMIIENRWKGKISEQIYKFIAQLKDFFKNLLGLHPESEMLKRQVRATEDILRKAGAEFKEEPLPKDDEKPVAQKSAGETKEQAPPKSEQEEKPATPEDIRGEITKLKVAGDPEGLVPGLERYLAKKEKPIAAAKPQTVSEARAAYLANSRKTFATQPERAAAVAEARKNLTEAETRDKDQKTVQSILSAYDKATKGKFGDNKIFINRLHEAMGRPGTLAEFKANLNDLRQKGLVSLATNDLNVPEYRADRAASEIDNGKLSPYHFVNAEETRKMQQSLGAAKPEDQGPFYSQLTRTVQALPQDTMTVGQAKAAITKGAKPDEIKASGILDDPLSPLAGKDANAKVTKRELEGYAVDRQTKVQDVILSPSVTPKIDPEKLIKDDELRRVDGSTVSIIDGEDEGGSPDGTYAVRYSDPESNGNDSFSYHSTYDEAREELLEAAKAEAEEKAERQTTEDQTQFSKFQLPGAEPGSYREQFFTWPSKSVDVHYDPFQENGAENTAKSANVEGASQPSGNWEDGHTQYSDVQNPVVRIRRNIRTDAYGKKTLFIEEMQGPQKSEQEKMPPEVRKRIYEIGMKRAIRDAVDSGADAIGWTSGETQADRYDLSKSVDSIEIQPLGKGRFGIVAVKDGDRNLVANNIPANELEIYVGKDIAKKVDPEEEHVTQTFEGDDLKAGGEGIKALYDKMLPNIANKLAEKVGGKVGASKVLSEVVPDEDMTGEHPQKQLVGIHSMDIPKAWKDEAPQFALYAATPEDSTKPEEESSGKPPSESPQDRPSTEGALAKGEDTQMARNEKLMEEAESAGLSPSLETIKGILRSDPKAMDKLRAMIKDRTGKDAINAATPDALGASNPLKSMRDTYDSLADHLAARATKKEIAYKQDAVGNIANYHGQQAGDSIRLDLPDKLDREAMPFVIEAGGDKKKMQAMVQKIAASKDPKMAAKFDPIVDHAINNFDRLDKARANHDKIMADSLAKLKANGIDVGEVENYVSRKLDSPEAQQDMMPNPLFSGGGGAGGGNPKYFTKGRTFETLADAIKAGFRPKSTDLADLDAHRIEAAEKIIGQKKLFDELKQTPSPTDGEPIIGQMEQVKKLNGKTEAQVPRGYSVVQAGGQPLVIHNDFASIFKNLFGSSAIRTNAAGRALIKAAAVVKHGTLAVDTFHIGRMLFKMATAGGGGPLTIRNGHPAWNIHKGRALLEYTDADLGRAQAMGDITKKEADYARTNRPKIEKLMEKGMNVGKVADNLMEQAKLHLPIVSKLNSWIFGKLSRSAMLQASLVNLDRNLKNPYYTEDQAYRQTAKEMNELFGNLQNQGILQNKTLQDISRLVFLAPNWTESQFRNEARAYAQAGKAPIDALRGRGFRLGNSARVFAAGLAALLAANQVINYLSRGQSTFENKEKDHKLDSWIPGGKRGFWFSPLEIAGEYAHASMKYLAQRENPVDVATHIMNNKLSPMARGAKEALTGRDAQGKHFLNNTDRFRGAAVDALPVPMFTQPFMERDPRSPTGFRATRTPAAGEKQFLQSVGMKVTAAQSPRSQMFAIAQPFRADRQQNDIAGEFTAMRQALDNGNEKAVKSEIKWLYDQGKAPDQIKKAVGISASGEIKPEKFAGSEEREETMLRALKPDDRQIYAKAQAEHIANATLLLKLLPQVPAPRIAPKASKAPSPYAFH